MNLQTAKNDGSIQLNLDSEYLSNMNVDAKQVKDFFDKFGNNHDSKDIYQNSYDVNHLKQFLVPCINKTYMLNIIPEIVNIICNYCGITDWSMTEKSDKFSIINSKDNNISYAILKSKDRCQETILLNEWIDLENTCKIYRYVFKFLPLIPKQMKRKHNMTGSIRVGFITPQFKMNFSNVDYKEMIGELEGDCAMCWFTQGSSHSFFCNGLFINTPSIDDNGEQIRGLCDFERGINYNQTQTQNESNYCNIFDGSTMSSYFMIELDLKYYKMTVVCDEIEYRGKKSSCDIPHDLLQNIVKLKQVRMGLSIYIDDAGVFGLGIVRINV